MATFKIHITGIVQGVGFRPFVYNLAQKHGISGTVSNNNEGVVIHLSTCDTCANTFLDILLNNAPEKAVITHTEINKVTDRIFQGFAIVESKSSLAGQLLITPDYALCEDCNKELQEPANRRFRYPFITCTNCGPRYSIIDNLPYDRPLTTMATFKMCPECQREYNDPTNRRFYSQTNSCAVCGVELQLFDTKSKTYLPDNEEEITLCIKALKAGKIIAVKGIGGYLLMADATNTKAIQRLRQRKNRPKKPFALMVSNEKMLRKYVEVRSFELDKWLHYAAPIILFKTSPSNLLPAEDLAPGLNELGIMRPYTPLHLLICQKFGKPLIATSANVTDSPIIYRNSDALKTLQGIADLILLHNRPILIPQDDSVLRFTDTGRKIVIRRSRGLAPNILGIPPADTKPTLAAGAMLKSAFAINTGENIFVSQYLGATNSWETQKAFDGVYQHLSKVLRFKPERIVADKHPGYFSTEWAQELAEKNSIPLQKVQHHEAHFCAVIGEHNGWDKEILGFIWDGTGLGNDGQIWGGETLLYRNRKIQRIGHLPYFKHIQGDKMVREPRIAALSVFSQIPEAIRLLKDKFTDHEWTLFNRQIETSTLLSSSVGRLFDAVSALLGICPKSTYHGEAAMLLEALAARHPEVHALPPYPTNEDDLSILLQALVDDIRAGTCRSEIAGRFHRSLAAIIHTLSVKNNAQTIAFSGGVFQNKLLLEMIENTMTNNFNLLFHKELSPNDECIAFGQLMRVSLGYKS